MANNYLLERNQTLMIMFIGMYNLYSSVMCVECNFYCSLRGNKNITFMTGIIREQASVTIQQTFSLTYWCKKPYKILHYNSIDHKVFLVEYSEPLSLTYLNKNAW